MFKPDSMCEVNIIFQKEKLNDLTDVLYEQELIEFFDIKNTDFEKFDHHDLNELSAKLLKIRSCITILKENYKKDLGNYQENAIDRTLELKNEIDELNKDLIKLEDEYKRSQIVKHLKLTPEEVKSKKITIGFVSDYKIKSFLDFRKLKVDYKTYQKDDRVYFYAKTKNVPFKFKDFYLPKESESNLNVKITKTENSIAKCELELRKLANNNLEHLRFLEHKLRKEVEVLESKPKFSTTKNITIVSGFVPKKSVKKFELAVNATLEGKCEIIIKDAKSKDIPIQLSNTHTVSKFEELLHMYSPPKYGEFAPTWLMFLIFPIFFGFILGDVIYGLISLIFFSILRLKFKEMKNFLAILQFSSVMSIVFGIIYGEFMGYELHGSFYGFFERAHHPETLLLFAVIFGLIHINLGLIIGMVNSMPDWKKAIYDKASYMVLQIGVGIIYLGFTTGDLIAKIIGWSLLALSIVLIYLGHGFIGIMEVPSFFTNILSYARLMAVGLSSVAIAILINDFSAVFFSKGAFGIVAGVLLFTLGHIFNIALGVFEGFLHTLRLHYVEFFTKFYSGGGREFKPFGKKVYE